MTEPELQAEWRHIYETRLGILCGAGEPTEEQLAIAQTEADKAVEELREDPL